jgi:hypothetical protein
MCRAILIDDSDELPDLFSEAVFLPDGWGQTRTSRVYPPSLSRSGRIATTSSDYDQSPIREVERLKK